MSTSGFAVFTYPEPQKSRVQVRLDQQAQGLGKLSIITSSGTVETFMGEKALISLRDQCESALGPDLERLKRLA